jgi:ABC-type phosphate/phosphonate transport system ATPase subunit
VLAGRLGYVPAWRGWLRRFSRADRLFALECLDRVGLLGQRADTFWVASSSASRSPARWRSRA